MDIDWVCKHHSDLSKEQLYAILKLRAEVFVVEQNCPYLDVDGLDRGRHLPPDGLAGQSSGGLPSLARSALAKQ